MALSSEDRMDIFFGFYKVLEAIQDVQQELNALKQEIRSFKGRMIQMTNEAVALIQEKLANQQAAIEQDTAIDSSASALLDQLAQLIRDNVTDTAALEAIAASIDSNNTTLAVNNQTLSDAVARNAVTPPAEPPTV